MALAMKVISQVEAQRKILEEAVSTALELASGKSDGAEVAVSKTTGISVSTRYGEVENVEFNSDGALGITVYHQNRKGSASSTDLSPQAIARTVQAALDIARYTSPDPCAGVADKELLAFDAPDLDLFHPAEVSPDAARHRKTGLLLSADAAPVPPSSAAQMRLPAFRLSARALPAQTSNPAPGGWFFCQAETRRDCSRQ